MLKNSKQKAAKAADPPELTSEQEAELQHAESMLLAGAAYRGRAGALMRIRPRVNDARAVSEIIGPTFCSTIEEVAMEFGVPVTEIEEWQRQGMPGPLSTEDAAARKAAFVPSEYWPPSSRHCELLRLVRPANLYVDDLVLLLNGDTTARTQDEVAKAFGVSVQTIKVWVGKGMPKPLRKGDPYNLISILFWRSREDERADAHQGKHY